MPRVAEPHQHQPPSPALTQDDPAAMKAPVSHRLAELEELFEIVDPISQYEHPFVPQEVLDEHAILLGSLDIRTGRLNRGDSGALLVPMPPCDVDRFVKKAKAKYSSKTLARDLISRSIPGESDDDGRKRRQSSADKYFQSFHISQHVEQYLFMTDMLKRKNWSKRVVDLYLENCNRDYTVRNEVQWLYDFRDEKGELIREAPFVTAYLIDQTPLEDGKVLTSELRAIFFLAAKSSYQPGLSGCENFIVTVITGSERRMRVVQGRINVLEPRIEINISESFDFEDGIHKNWEKWTTVLGWFAGAPQKRRVGACAARSSK